MFTIIWLPSVLDDLAAIWLNAADRDAVNRAVSRIDQLLAAAPTQQGESRPRRARIMFERPLAVTFEVDEANRTVFVVGVRGY